MKLKEIQNSIMYLISKLSILNLLMKIPSFKLISTPVKPTTRNGDSAKSISLWVFVLETVSSVRELSIAANATLNIVFLGKPAESNAYRDTAKQMMSRSVFFVNHLALTVMKTPLFVFLV